MRALGGRWRVVRVGAGSLIYRQIKSLHCSGYLLVNLIKQPQNLFEFIVKHCIFT